MYEFFPRLPTAIAWKERTFENMATLDDIIYAMKAMKQHFRGEVLIMPDEKVYIPFRSVGNLVSILRDTPERSISRIYIFEIGYFRKRR